MDSKNTWKVQSAIAILLILFIFFIPIPKIISLFLIWIVLLILVNILSGCWFFSFFISTTFVILLFFFLLQESKKQNLEFRQAFMENFANTEKAMESANKEVDVEGQASNDKESDNVPLSVDEPIVAKKEEVVEKPNTIEVDQDKVTSSDSLDKPNSQEISAHKETIANVPKLPKISMMDNSDDEGDVFGKLDTGEFEDSDEDSDDDESELEKKVGKTSVSSKQAYKAQKQLYDLTTAVSKLHDNMEKLAPSLKKGQKIIESMSKMGIKLV